MSKPVRFWDAINGCREEAVEVGQFGVTMSLIEYAEGDHDGVTDGMYIDQRFNSPNPHPFTVEYDDGSTETWEVFGELSIDFHAHCKKEGDGE